MSSSDRSEDDFQDLFENAPCGYLSLGSDGRIVRVNTTLCSWLGRTPDQLIGKRFREFLNVAGSIFYETHFAPLLQIQGAFEEVALDLLTLDGAIVPVLASAAERRVLGKVVSTRITVFRALQRRRHERELGELNSGLQTQVTAASALQLVSKNEAELREQFIAVLGHDLRNPLAGLSGGTNILTQMHTDAKSVRVLRLMGESVARMGGLIDNLLDFARGRLGAGIGLELTKGARIEPVLAKIVNEITAAHPQREIRIDFDLPKPVDVDPARIGQMFSNLLGNAITHGDPEKAVVVTAKIVYGAFELMVCNGGELISPPAMEQLFQPFYRGKVRPSQQGLGLGLFIASEIAKAHGGTLKATSDDDETCFTFRMPVGATDRILTK
ncbi:MAG: PAS domain-containing sensor histidine kinase [Candidatus Devosia phytovorans]|uniref:histidine kinase n=1 Tax=Candidatus Devosia phytovorans TaxID=3121372 RepID=A0AAJ5VTV9_9HYPH|nr:PAS domain-containing sensor histidine kinase [Devosia sp.]WEK03244.1 MAG: PAS domain-containing sensor histidine kinase [Devosia sp.]